LSWDKRFWDTCTHIRTNPIFGVYYPDMCAISPMYPSVPLCVQGALLSFGLLHRPNDTFGPGEMTSFRPQTPFGQLARLRIIPTPIIPTRSTIQMGILIPLNPFLPRPTNHRTINQHIYLLRMKPTLRILIPRPLNRHTIIHNHKFNMTRPLLPHIMYRTSLICCDIIIYL